MSDLKQTMRDSAAKQLVHTAVAAKKRAEWAAHRAVRFHEDHKTPIPQRAREYLEQASHMITAALEADDELRNAA